MLILADARRIPLRDGCVQCVVTSPPYWGLRDYGTAQWEGGDPICDHKMPFTDVGHIAHSTLDGGKKTNAAQIVGYRGQCGKCGAARIDNQIGLEADPDAYVASLCTVFAEVWRVLKDDGVCWLNLGDSYGTGGSGQNFYDPNGDRPGGGRAVEIGAMGHRKVSALRGFHKQLIGIPWRVAFALQADGWYLRSDIIWAKKNCMPESVTDRPTKAHEYIFMLAKGQSRTRVIQFANLNPERVHFGLDFGKQTPGSDVVKACVSLASAFFYGAQLQHDFSLPPFYSEVWQQRAQEATRNLSSSLPAIERLAAHASRFLIADISTKEFLTEVQRIWRDLGQADHFLIRRGLAECAHAPSVLIDGDAAIAINHTGQIRKFQFLHGNIVDTVSTTCNYYYDADAVREPHASLDADGNHIWTGRKPSASMGIAQHKVARQADPAKRDLSAAEVKGMAGLRSLGYTQGGRNKRSVWTIPTQPYSGAHFATMPEALIEPCILAGCPVGGLVLDPFIGSGTVGAVAERLGRRWVGTDLSYQDLATERTAQRGIRWEEVNGGV